jgi:hypothetical protein
MSGSDAYECIDRVEASLMIVIVCTARLVNGNRGVDCTRNGNL